MVVKGLASMLGQKAVTTLRRLVLVRVGFFEA